jgi:transposase
MSSTVTPHLRQVAKREVVRQIERGVPVREARRISPVPMHRTTVYRLLKRAQREGEQTFIEGRHGHPVKLRGELLTFLLDYCQSHPAAPSREVQSLLTERFSLSVSVSQLNRVRAAHSLSRQSVPREKKAENRHGDRVRLS